MSASSVQIVLVPVPVAGPDWNRFKRPEHSHHKAKREAWKPADRIPQRPPVDRELVDRMREIAKRAIENAKPQIEAMLGHAKLAA
jgi:hypothetical protein